MISIDFLLTFFQYTDEIFRPDLLIWLSLTKNYNDGVGSQIITKIYKAHHQSKTNNPSKFQNISFYRFQDIVGTIKQQPTAFLRFASTIKRAKLEKIMISL